MINGRSTKEFTDRDWDAYRNNSVGFVFQSYNLISHQTVLSNVELALTLAGVDREERRKRAEQALIDVGLGDHLHKLPNELSGGQMQRVAIARSLVNNPDILLADEPTGALDSETSLQIMALLQEIAKDRLVIMVTHNPELAEDYSSRIVELKDGQILADSHPYFPEKENLEEASGKKPGKLGKTAMSFWTALSLSFNNLKTKKGRTLLTAFAGSIGIIGIGLILSLSNGIQSYINQVQEETLSAYPISITEDQDPIMSLIEQQSGGQEREEEPADGIVEANEVLVSILNAQYASDVQQNDLTDFKKKLDEELAKPADPEEENLSSVVSTVQYQYAMPLNTYVLESELAANPSDDYRSTALNNAVTTRSQVDDDGGPAPIEADEMWVELVSDENGEGISQMHLDQYDVVAGQWPQAANEVVVVLDDNNTMPDVAFYSLGLVSQSEVRDILRNMQDGKSSEIAVNEVAYDDLLNVDFKLLLNHDYFVKNPDETWEDIRQDPQKLNLAIEDGYDLDVVGILKPKPDAEANSINGYIGYTSDLTKAMISESQESQIIQEQSHPDNENWDVIAGLPFEVEADKEASDEEKAAAIKDYFAGLTTIEKSQVFEDLLALVDPDEMEVILNQLEEAYPTRQSMLELASQILELSQEQTEEYLANYSDEEIRDFINEMAKEAVQEDARQQAQGQIYQLQAQAGQTGPFSSEANQVVADAFDQYVAQEDDPETLLHWYDEFMPNVESDSSLADNLEMMGAVSPDSPSAIQLYAASFEDKDRIDDFIVAYNEGQDEEDQIQYTDYVGLIMSGVTVMINAVTYGLIFFVSISLVVSSIMIGIITYISVLERTKEIGILRSLGASKRDISRVFNAETIIIGLSSGLLGIGITLILNIPINLIMESLTGIENISILPGLGALILVLLSVFLTFLAGLIPSSKAANQDPVTALRSD